MEKIAPFKSKAQMKFFFAKEKRGGFPKGTARQWAHETPDIAALPEHVKNAFLDLKNPFAKIAKLLFNPEKSPPIPIQVQQKDVIEETKKEKTGGKSPVEYRNELTARRTGIIKRHRQTAKAS